VSIIDDSNACNQEIAEEGEEAWERVCGDIL
jgi:hypothetical protein